MFDDDGFIYLIFLVIIIAFVARLVQGILFVRNLSRSRNDIEALFKAIQNQIASASAAGPARRPAGGARQAMSPQMITMMAQYRNQMAQLDALHQAQYDVKMGELEGMAANAGIDWNRNSF